MSAMATEEVALATTLPALYRSVCHLAVRDVLLQDTFCAKQLDLVVMAHDSLLHRMVSSTWLPFVLRRALQLLCLRSQMRRRSLRKQSVGEEDAESESESDEEDEEEERKVLVLLAAKISHDESLPAEAQVWCADLFDEVLGKHASTSGSVRANEMLLRVLGSVAMVFITCGSATAAPSSPTMTALSLPASPTSSQAFTALHKELRDHILEILEYAGGGEHLQHILPPGPATEGVLENASATPSTITPSFVSEGIVPSSATPTTEATRSDPSTFRKRRRDRSPVVVEDDDEEASPDDLLRGLLGSDLEKLLRRTSSETRSYSLSVKSQLFERLK